MDKEMQFLVFGLKNKETKIKALIRDETIWLTQRAMGELFDCSTENVLMHLKNIYKEGELEENLTSKEFLVVQLEGTRNVERNLLFYNLDAIISVGYRINSAKATQFRIWATKVLKEFMTKGFVLDDERLKQGTTAFGKDYFRELLERVRSIRASERRIWQQITDIFAECSIDYNNNTTIAKNFYATIQNKFHYAITGKTAAEIIYLNANHKRENMGLTTWKNSPDGRILKSDTTIAKNYLQEKEIKKLERTVSSYFDYIEGLIERENTFTMAQFAESVDKFLTFNEYKILPDNGKISATDAKEKAEFEYDIFNKTQKIESDFDKIVKKMISDKKDEE